MSVKNKFIIVPSLKIIDEKLENQINVSWGKAVEIIKKHHRKVYPFYDVIINFDQKLGEYVGNSLGIALTLAFLQELFSFYNTPIKLKIISGSAFTGGINEKGELVPIGNAKYIQSKIKCSFFSTIEMLVLHKSDEETARNELDKYLEKYPDRKLKIIGIEDFDDLLNRRDLVDVKKQNLIIRTGRFVRKQKVALIILLISLLGLLYLNIDFDNNPAYMTNSPNTVYVHNKNGRVLWQKKIHNFIDNQYNDKGYMALYEKIVNINNDDNNEVILSDYDLSKSGNERNSFVMCFNYSGKLIWKYKFADSVKTIREIHNASYVSQIIDTLSENGRQEIILYARNDPLYPSAIYKLDAKTGKRLPGTFWHAGHICAVTLGDFDDNGKKEIVATAISNCYERCVIFSIDVDKIEGQGPSDKDYTFLGFQRARLNKYILLPKSDLTDFYGVRFNTTPRTRLFYDQSIHYFNFSLMEGNPSKFDAGITYSVNDSLSSVNISIGDQFQVMRDSLVAKGLLHKPYSNTKEYVNILKKQIKYWDGKEFKRMY